MAKAYGLNARPCSVALVEASPGHALLRLEEVYWFLDSHHVGAFEGVLRHAGVKGSVSIHCLGPGRGDMLVQWET